MGFLSKLFATGKREKPYVDAGTLLTNKLIQGLRLDGWQNLLPVYTQEEMQTIDRELSAFQQSANEAVGGEARFHPEVVGPIIRMHAAEALEHFAGRGWRFTDKSELPQDWKRRVSTYLKAWASGLNPRCLMEMAEMLAKAGYKTEAKDALEVVLLFPTYAHVFYGGTDKTELVNRIVGDAQNVLRDL